MRNGCVCVSVEDATEIKLLGRREKSDSRAYPVHGVIKVWASSATEHRSRIITSCFHLIGLAVLGLALTLNLPLVPGGFSRVGSMTK